MSDVLRIDGSYAEGGGQILRTALALSVITQRPFVIEQIRAGRVKPGLLRQHLACIRAAQAVSEASVEGAYLHAQTLYFAPQQAGRNGDYVFEIGSAGSTTLVLQTVLPILMHCGGSSQMRIVGGTHNPFAPSADFLMHSFAPTVAELGWQLTIHCPRAGFAPLGGGVLAVQLQRTPPTGGDFDHCARGPLQSLHFEIGLLNLEHEIGLRISRSALSHLDAPLSARCTTAIRHLEGIGQGVMATATVVSSRQSEVFTVLGEQHLRAEQVGKRLAGLVQRYLHQAAATDAYLSDQLLLPLALTGGGVYTARVLTDHIRAQIETIRRFLPVRIVSAPLADGTSRIEVRP